MHFNKVKLIYSGPFYEILQYCSGTVVNHGWRGNGIPLYGIPRLERFYFYHQSEENILFILQWKIYF